MPRYQTLQPDEIEYVKKQGLDPEKYLYDAEGQQLISREDAPDLTLMESGLETTESGRRRLSFRSRGDSAGC